ncbi:MAG: hypothetical protein JSC189_000292 [Candidatus Tokpelaia sp. JSC189]|nr:MAG: hypothetical protein JSC189_000292 [Candidatus Tokpelaia sp. JSC189]
MHIEPNYSHGRKDCFKLCYSYRLFRFCRKNDMEYNYRVDGGFSAFCMRVVITTGLVFSFFEILPH